MKNMLIILAVAMVVFAVASAQSSPKTPTITPSDLAKTLQSSGAEKPLLIQVGFHVLYTQAHIPGSEYIGPASEESGLQKLRERVKSLPKNKPIVLYCGCCPWDRCPNLQPAAKKLHTLGFTNVKLLHIAGNFGTDWVDKGFPTAKGD